MGVLILTLGHYISQTDITFVFSVLLPRMRSGGVKRWNGPTLVNTQVSARGSAGACSPLYSMKSDVKIKLRYYFRKSNKILLKH